ncbi:MAG: hypothetical protein ACI9IP_001943 [Arcticibacterium sp.]|jgi:hypothetical protein
MKEDFLHYLWQFQKFDKQRLFSTEKEKVSILVSGLKNTDSGPDFRESRVKIGEVEWAGSVEIHLKSSDWLKHKHQNDPAYENVILHVVWEHDKEIAHKDGRAIPTLSLASITNPSLVSQYESLMNAKDKIPCQKHFPEVSDIKKFSMIERALVQRMERKGEEVSQRLAGMGNDWEEVTYQVLLRNFGFKLNNEAFLRLAENLPFNILKKYNDSALQIEALLFGMAGLLASDLDIYGQKLAAEFKFLAQKHGLTDNVLNPSEWKFMRTRPANFPTVRLSQIAALMTHSKGLFSILTETSEYLDLSNFLKAKPSEYWQSHYHFGKESARKFKGMGEKSIQNLIINTAVPVLVAYGNYVDSPSFIEKAMKFLEDIPSEKNWITKFWNSEGLETKTMFDSQGSIELYNEFCQKRKCLSCGVGVEILK